MVAKQKEYIPELDERGFMRHLDDLKKGYRKTLRILESESKRIVDYIESDTGMTIEALGEKKGRSIYKQWKQTNDGLWEEYRTIREMISDVNYAIEWLHTGRQPRSKRGIDRRSVYQRTVFMDPAIMERYMRPTNSRSASTLTEEQKDKLRDVLEILSPRERECYEMHYGQGFSYGEIAGMLNIQKGSVEEYVKRAHAKVSAGWQGTLF